MAARQTPELRKQTILDAALRVFAQQSFEAATTDDISRAAGLSKGGLYWHFKSKDDILAAILVQLFDQELGVLQALVSNEGDAVPRIRQLVRQSIAAILDMGHILPVAIQFYALAARSTHVRQFLQKYYQRYHQLLSVLFAQGFAQGEFRRGTPESAAITLIAELEGLGLLWAIAPQLVQLSDQAAAAVELLLAGLAYADTDAP
jgi:TetR/AcrR family acrAB operon transcriptional repressor